MNDMVVDLISEIYLAIEVAVKWTLWIFAGHIEVSPVEIRLYSMHSERIECNFNKNHSVLLASQ